MKSPSITPLKSPNFAGSMKNDGTKYTFPFKSGCCVNRLFHASTTLPCPNWQFSPEKVDTKARPSYWSWLGCEACVRTSVCRDCASSAELQGRELEGSERVSWENMRSGITNAHHVHSDEKLKVQLRIKGSLISVYFKISSYILHRGICTLTRQRYELAPNCPDQCSRQIHRSRNHGRARCRPANLASYKGKCSRPCGGRLPVFVTRSRWRRFVGVAGW